MRRQGRGERDGRVGTPVVRPDHLVVWLRGVGDGMDPPIVLDDELVAAEFDVTEWNARVRKGYPAALACMVHDSGDVSEEWISTLDRTVRAICAGGSRFTGDTLPTSPARLRRWVRESLLEHAVVGGADPSGAVDDVVLVADELVTNAGAHADTWVTVDLVLHPDGVIVAVADPRPDVPAMLRSAAPEDESGRGLRIVSELSPRWGVLVARTMKTVWAWLPSDASEPEARGRP